MHVHNPGDCVVTDRYPLAALNDSHSLNKKEGPPKPTPPNMVQIY